MNGYERIMRALAGKETDRVPTMLHCFMAAAEQLGYTMQDYRNDPVKIANSHIAFAEKYELDGILVDIDTCIEASVIGVPVDYPVHEPARSTGALSLDMDVLLKAMDPQKLMSSPRVEILLESIRQLKTRVGNQLAIRGNCDQSGFSLAMLAYGMNDFMADLLDEDLEDDIIQLIDKANLVHLKLHSLMREAGADITSFGDSSAGPDLISRELYLRFAKPSHKQIAEDAKKSGVPVICHICGNLDLILEDVLDVGFTALEVDYKTNVPRLATLSKQYKTPIFGIIDPSGMFYYGTPEKMEIETKRVLDAFEGKGIVIGAGCALPEKTPDENIRAFVKTVKAYR